MKKLLLLASISTFNLVSISCSNDKIKSDTTSEKIKSTEHKVSQPTKESAKQLDVKWLIKSKEFDDRSLVHQVVLVVNGQEHKIEDEVYSLKDKGEYGPHNAQDIKAYQSLSGYNFEWHVSSANFYVKKEGANLVVYAEESSDENEGKAETRKIKTISIN